MAAVDRPAQLLRDRPVGPGRGGVPPAGRRVRHQPVAARRRAGRDGRRRRAAVQRDAGRAAGIHLLRPGGARGRLHRLPVPVLLRHERLPVDVLRGQRPRGRLGAGDRLPDRARRRVDRRAEAELGGLRRARPARGRPAPPLRRPAAVPVPGHPPGGERGRRFARQLLLPRRVRVLGAAAAGAPGPADGGHRPPGVARVAAPGHGRPGRRRVVGGLHRPLHRLRPGRRAAGRTGHAERLGPGADHRGRAVAGPLPRAVGPGHR